MKEGSKYKEKELRKTEVKKSGRNKK